jgi:hypothetical protein
MIKLGFHPTWVNWIRICVSSSSFSILLNGSPFGKFTPSRGLRQGDPLSPFLFILGTEVLSRLFHQQESIGLLKGIRIAKACPPINHLLFAVGQDKRSIRGNHQFSLVRIHHLPVFQVFWESFLLNCHLLTLSIWVYHCYLGLLVRRLFNLYWIKFCLN